MKSGIEILILTHDVDASTEMRQQCSACRRSRCGKGFFAASPQPLAHRRRAETCVRTAKRRSAIRHPVAQRTGVEMLGAARFSKAGGLLAKREAFEPACSPKIASLRRRTRKLYGTLWRPLWICIRQIPTRHAAASTSSIPTTIPYVPPTFWLRQGVTAREFTTIQVDLTSKESQACGALRWGSAANGWLELPMNRCGLWDTISALLASRTFR